MEENTYENVTNCLASSFSHSNIKRLQVVGDVSAHHQSPCRSKTDLDIEIPSHYDVPRIQHRSQSMTALNVLSTHHRLNVGSRSGSSSPLSDRSVEFHSSVPVSPESYRHEYSPLMSNRDWSVYNSLGTSSSKEGKVCTCMNMQHCVIIIIIIVVNEYNYISLKVMPMIDSGINFFPPIAYICTTWLNEECN